MLSMLSRRENWLERSSCDASNLCWFGDSQCHFLPAISARTQKLIEKELNKASRKLLKAGHIVRNSREKRMLGQVGHRWGERRKSQTWEDAGQYPRSNSSRLPDIGSEKLRTLFTAPGNFFLKLKKVMRYAQSPNRVSKRAMSAGGIRRHLGNLETWWSTVVQVIREMEDVKKADRAVQQSQQE